jgi:pimeloyl-ACP methyl ester carboxylesterase
MLRRLVCSAVLLLTIAPAAGWARSRDVFDRVRDGYADNRGVRIHYAALGRRGPLIVMIHGFPDFWYSWRDQMDALSRRYRVVAMDQRGYNLSDKPAAVEAYGMPNLVEDVAAVIRAEGEERAVIAGHDWGGAVAWFFAMLHPEMTERLIILNLPHPRCMLRELRTNPRQEANSAYARAFQAEGAERALTPEGLAAWVADPVARTRYVDAFRQSDIAAMLAYYKRNYPRAPYGDVDLPIVQPPVLQIHGLRDPFLLPEGLDGTWQWLAQPWTLVTIPEAGHFVQQDASATVTKTIKEWLTSQGVR